MIIVLKQQASPEQISTIQEHLHQKKLTGHLIEGDERKVLAVIGNVPNDTREIALLPGVSEVVRVGKPYKLASREAADSSPVAVGQFHVGGQQLVVMAGPCSVESREGFLLAARQVAEAGAQIIRGGAYKPRTSPYAFQGLGVEGLEILAEARETLGLPVVTEVVSPSHVEIVSKYVDLLQIGARNMQNFELLKAASQSNKPVLLKRGMYSTLEEWLNCAEYILAEGNPDVILCERGIRTFETYTRNTLDLSMVPAVREVSHLPVIIDPSHGTGRKSLVGPMSLASLAAGADGLEIEVHYDPSKAMSDADQQLTIPEFKELMTRINTLKECMKTVS